MLLAEPNKLVGKTGTEEKIADSQELTIQFCSKSMAAENSVLACYENSIAVKIDGKDPQGLGTDGTQNSLTVLFCPASTASLEWKNWLVRNSDKSSQVSASILGGRITKNATRAVYCGVIEHFDYALKIIAQFSLLDHELVRLETSASAALTASESDVVLTHQVTEAQFSQGPHVNEMTALIARELIALTRLDGYFTRLGISTSDEHKLLLQLMKAAEFDARMQYLDDVIEVVADIYELANDRLSECTYFHKEYRIELWIVLILVAELLLLVVDIFAHYGQ